MLLSGSSALHGVSEFQQKNVKLHVQDSSSDNDCLHQKLGPEDM